MTGRVFDDVRLEWGGKVYTVPSDRIMGAIRRIEKHLTLHEMQVMISTRGTISLSAVAMAYAELLDYAGVPAVSDQVVYRAMFFDQKAQETGLDALRVLMALMTPPKEAVRPGDDVA